MSTEEILQPFRDNVKIQGDLVRKLKEENASNIDIKKAVIELKARKKVLDDKMLEFQNKEKPFDRVKFEDTMKQRFFYDQSFSIYGGITGLYDFGPMGCAIKSNILSIWRGDFIVRDQLLEVDCSVLTPDTVLKTSGHVDRFTDVMVKDLKTGECFRVDHLIEGILENKLKAKDIKPEEKKDIENIIINLENYGLEEFDKLIQKFNIKSPITNNDLSESQQFNLMFGTQIGPTGLCRAFLRPETAQGMFVNFQRLLQFNQGKLPFGVAQIGLAFRNEISPRSGLLRVREFTMAEIEYFIDPKLKSECPKFSEVENYKLKLYSACDQMDGKSACEITAKEAVDNGIIANNTLAYFMVRIQQFLLKIGIDGNRLRFRQHMANEMAHYACDCWDAECQSSYGWVECVGCADRSCFDLTQHSNATNTRMVAEKLLPEPYMKSVCQVQPDKPSIGKLYKGEGKMIIEKLNNYSTEDARHLKKALEENESTKIFIDGKDYEITSKMAKFKEFEQKVHVEEIMPSVIEPSFGIGRILYSVLEHNFKIREDDEQRTYLSLPIQICPYKCSILPLSTKEEFTPFVRRISSELTKLSVPHKIDETSGSIGRRYARTDQIAIPFGVTVDFDTINVEPNSVTLRERDTMKQIRVNLKDLPKLVADLSKEQMTWNDAMKIYPEFKQQETA